MSPSAGVPAPPFPRPARAPSPKSRAMSARATLLYACYVLCVAGAFRGALLALEEGLEDKFERVSALVRPYPRLPPRAAASVAS